jgi:hypothetical protein
MKRILICFAFLIPLLACSGPTDEGDIAPPPAAVQPRSEGGAREDRDSGHARKHERKSRPGDDKGVGEGGQKTSSDGEAPTASPDGGSPRGRKPHTPRMRPPGAGEYTYAQEGWEEICQAGVCDRTDLPSHRQVTIQHERDDGSVFSTTTRGAGAREQSIIYTIRRDGVLIRRISSDFRYGAFRTRSTIAPDPPIVTARLPFRVGSSWTGEWKDRRGKVDGTYRFHVKRRDTLGERDLFVVEMRMSFRGAYNGFTEMTLWVMPRSFSIAASQGITEITSDFGTSRTESMISLT